MQNEPENLTENRDKILLAYGDPPENNQTAVFRLNPYHAHRLPQEPNLPTDE